MMKTIDLTGMKFNNLTVIEQAETKILPCGQHKTMWKCKCKCGKETIVSSHALRNNGILSCRECGIKRSAETRKKLDNKNIRLYHIWNNMRQRCNNPKHNYFKNYGGRGITICDEWSGEKGFENFYKWSMENGYSDELTIDRIDNDNGYSPQNCRWATRKEQANNTRKNKIIEFNGEEKTLSQWADFYGLSQDLLGERLLRGKTMEESIRR